MFKLLGSLFKWFGGLKVWIQIIAILVIVLIVGGLSFKAYYEHVQTKFEAQEKALQDEKTRADNEAARADAAVTDLRTVQKNFADQEKSNKELEGKREDIRRGSQKTAKTLAKHDLEKLSKAKPLMIETRINDGTAAALRRLEEITQPESYDAWRDTQ
jgi:predicted Holliday junction resolvase-like endonuclease